MPTPRGSRVFARDDRREPSFRARHGRRFPWREVENFADIGCAQGGLTAEIALAHPHLSATGFDLPAVGPVFERYIASHGLSSRVRFQSGDFFTENLPSTDVIIMGHILHDWDLPQKRMLLRKAHDALPAGGRRVVYDSIIDDDRRANAHGLLMSLNMLIETPGSSITPAPTASAGRTKPVSTTRNSARSTDRHRWSWGGSRRKGMLSGSKSPAKALFLLCNLGDGDQA